ncbi:EAL domain-containing protein [Thalassotalea sp. PLHSN55]|uniref:bifunctional diguanylate cyclase/phosphodiesterase n=1 Tax=Thalassotalea sp. PLHSN55 TaxID=3435888 RepID=UPI003F828E07
MKSLQNKIFLLFVVLLLLVQAVGIWTIYEGNRTQERQAIESRLKTAQTIFTEQFQDRREYLSAFAETAARDYGIKQVFNDDVRSLLVALNNHRKRIDADLAMTISADGIVTGQIFVEHINNATPRVLAGSERAQNFRYPQWLELEQQSNLYRLDGRLYQLSLSPLEVGQKVIGWVGFGFQLDNRLTQHFKNITQLEIDFLLAQGVDEDISVSTGLDAKEKTTRWQLIASSNSNSNLEFSQNILVNNIPANYIATNYIVNVHNQPQFGVAMYGLKADIVEVLQSKWWQFLILAALTLLLSLVSAYWIAASVTKPVRQLVKQAKIVAQGQYDRRLAICDKSELGQLAQEFNVMQQAVLSREQAIKHSADHDGLTDLPNRNVLVSTMSHLIEQETAFSILHLNLSRLKDVNETLGHDAGDWLIKHAAKLLNKLNDIELLCHLGSDEFVIVSTNITDAENHQLVKQLHQILDEGGDYYGVILPLQMRIGIASYPKHSHGLKSLLQMADLALNHTSKHNNGVQVYDDSLDVNSIERLSLINDLKQAIAEQQLTLFYQPKVDLKTGSPTHAEALVRWHHPKLGMLPPDEFIPIAEQTGQINALTQCVLLMALKQHQQWQQQGIDINIAVNISAENLKDAKFLGFVRDAIASYNIPSNKLTLEVTESVVVEDPQAAILLLQQFKDLGFKISIDDYGTGYSSLAQLKQLPVHELKIDKSFVQKLKDDEDDQTIVRSTIELAHNMGLTVVAEGIEDEFALAWLAKHGCEYAQGYFISRPQPVDQITQWLLSKPVYKPLKDH